MTLSEVKKRIGESQMNTFKNWFYGEMSILVNGEVHYFDTDVELFMGMNHLEN